MFTAIDWAALVKIIGIDLMLGVDNAIVIALACASLPLAMRRRAVICGTAGAIVLRAVLLVFASYLLGVPYIKLIAGAYLLYVGFKLLMENDDAHAVGSPDHIMGAVKTILIADFMMSLDNVLGVASAAQSAGEHSNVYAIAGVLLSVPVIVFGAQGVLKLMDKFPIIIWGGAGLLGWVGAEMLISDPQWHVAMAAMHISMTEEMHLSFKIAGFAAVIFTVLAAKHAAKRKEVAA